MEKRPYFVLILLFCFKSFLVAQKSDKSLLAKLSPNDSIRLEDTFFKRKYIQIKDIKSDKFAICVVSSDVLNTIDDNSWTYRVFNYGAISVGIETYLTTLILSSKAADSIKFEVFDKEDLSKLKFRSPYKNDSIQDLYLLPGKMDILNVESQRNMLKHYNSDYLIIIVSRPYKETKAVYTNSYIHSGDYSFISNGICRFVGENFIYASQRTLIYDLKSGKKLKRGDIKQSSVDYLPVSKFYSDISNYNKEEMDLINNSLKKRIKNNLRQTFRLIGLEL